MLQQNFLVDSLISQVQTTALSPSSQSQFQSPQILQLMNNELKLTITSLIKSVQEEYFVNQIQMQVIAGTSYAIPARAVGGGLRQIILKDTNGNWIDITKMALEDIVITSFTFYSLPIWNYGYYMLGNTVNLFPQQGVSLTQYQLTVNFERQPNDLILSTNAGQIQSVNPSTNQITLSYVDPSWTQSTTFDIISPQPQFDSVGDDQVQTAPISGTTLTLSSLPVGVGVGQWVCPSGQSCIPQIPYALFPLLVQRTVIRMAEALGDSQMAQTARNTYEEMKEAALKILTPRVENDLKIIVNKNKAFTGYTYGLPWSR